MDNMIGFVIMQIITSIGVIAIYVLAIVALVYFIKALRIYIKKNNEY